MKKRTATVLLALSVSIICILGVAVPLFLYKPWTHSTNIEDALITNIKTLQSVDGRLYSYGEEISEVKVLEDYADTPYARLENIADAPMESPHAYNCIVIADIGGTVFLQDGDYEYLRSLVHEKSWWLMYMGTNQEHIAQFVRHGLCPDDIEDGGFMYRNSTEGNYSNTWNDEDTRIYNSVNRRLAAERMLSDLLYAISHL